MDHQDHVQTAEADLLMENVLSKPSDKFDSKHATDFIQNEVQSYDNVFVAKKPEVKENGDHLGLEQTEQISPVDLMNSSTHELTSSLLLTQQVDALDNKMTDIPMHSTAESPDADLLDVADISPNTVSGPYADLLREVADISPIKTVDLVDIEKPSKDLLVEETKFSPTIPEPDIIGDNAQFHLREKTVDHVEELIKPSDISVVPDSCDLISNKPKETKSTPSPVEPVVIEAEPPKSEPKGNEATETIKCVKPVTAKGNPSEKSEIGPKDFFTKYGLGKCLIFICSNKIVSSQARWSNFLIGWFHWHTIPIITFGKEIFQNLRLSHCRKLILICEGLKKETVAFEFMAKKLVSFQDWVITL